VGVIPLPAAPLALAFAPRTPAPCSETAAAAAAGAAPVLLVGLPSGNNAAGAAAYRVRAFVVEAARQTELQTPTPDSAHPAASSRLAASPSSSGGLPPPPAALLALVPGGTSTRRQPALIEAFVEGRELPSMPADTATAAAGGSGPAPHPIAAALNALLASPAFSPEQCGLEETAPLRGHFIAERLLDFDKAANAAQWATGGGGGGSGGAPGEDEQEAGVSRQEGEEPRGGVDGAMEGV
jgi:hypothetical protein